MSQCPFRAQLHCRTNCAVVVERVCRASALAVDDCVRTGGKPVLFNQAITQGQNDSYMARLVVSQQRQHLNGWLVYGMNRG